MVNLKQALQLTKPTERETLWFRQAGRTKRGLKWPVRPMTLKQVQEELDMKAITVHEIEPRFICEDYSGMEYAVSGPGFNKEGWLWGYYPECGERRLDQACYVLNQDGKPLMPSTRYRHIKLLLKNGKARKISSRPFVVQLLYPTGDAIQPLFPSMDPDQNSDEKGGKDQ